MEPGAGKRVGADQTLRTRSDCGSVVAMREHRRFLTLRTLMAGLVIVVFSHASWPVLALAEIPAIAQRRRAEK